MKLKTWMKIMIQMAASDIAQEKYANGIRASLRQIKKLPEVNKK